MKAEKKKKTLFFIICLFILIFFCTCVYSFYTDHHSAVNEFTVGEVKIKLREPLYELPENKKKRKNLAAGDSFIKDPAVTNIGKSDCYVILEIKVPLSNRTFIDDDGQRLPEENRNLFTFAFQPHWMVLNEEQEEHDTKYILAYAEHNQMTALMPGETTENLFIDNKVLVNNIIELSEKETMEIPVKAYGIQTTDLAAENGEGAENPEKIYSLLMNQFKAEQQGKEANLP